MLGVPPPLTTESVRYSTGDLPLDTARWKATGFSPRFAFEEGIRLTLAWGRGAGLLGR